MAVSYVTYTGDGSTTQYVITFEYISRDDVVVQVNDVNAAFTFINDTTVEITNTPSSGDKINIKRETPLTPLVDFADGSTLFESDLDLSAKQSRYLASEARDRADEAIAFIDTNIDDVVTVSNISTDVVTVAGQISPTNNIQTLAEIQDGTNATNAITTAASISTAISNVSSISSAVSTVSSDSADVQTLAGISADIQTLADIEDGTTATDAISGVAAIATEVSTVSGISTEVTNVAGKLTEIERLGTADAVADLAILGTTDAVADMNTLAAISTDIESVADKASFITADFVSDLNTLATTDVVADLNTLATSDIVADINLLAQTDVIADLNTLATTDIVSDLNTLATTDIVADLNQLATSDFVSDLNTMATTTNVNNLSTVAGDIANINAVAADATDIGVVAADLAGSDNIGTVAGGLTNINSVAGAITNINTVATNITGVNSFAERYRVDSTDPSTDNDAGDLFYNTGSNAFKFWNGTQWNVINTDGITAVVDDTTPQLGGNLDLNSSNITGTGNVTITGSVTSDNLAEHVVRLVADGAISDGDVVSLTSEGKVKAVGETTISAASLSNVTEIFDNSGTTISGFDFCYYASQKKILAVYADDANTSDAKAVAIDINGDGSFTVGTAVTFDTSTITLMRIEYDVEHDVAVVVYNQIGDLHAIPIKLEGSTITYGTSVEIHTYVPDQISMHYAPEYGRHLVVYGTVSNSDFYSSTIKVDNTGTFPQVTTTSAHRISTYDVRWPDVAYHAPTGHFIAIIENDQYSDAAYFYTLRLTEDGQYMTFGSFFSISDTYIDVANVIVHPKTGYIYAVFVDGTITEIKVYSYDGETFTYESGTSVDSYGFYPDVIYHPPTDKFVVTYTKQHTTNGVSEVVYSRSFSPNGNSITLDDADADLNDVLVSATNGGRAIKTRYIEEEDVVINMFATDVDVTSNPLNIATQSVRGTYSNNSDLIGVSSATYADGDTAKIQIHGSVDDAQSGLTAGWTYFVDDDGSLTRLNNGNKIGRAISSTKLLIDTAMSGVEMDEYLGGKANA